MAKESAENIQKLKSCWDSGDAACVADTRSKMELDDKAYTELRQQDNMAGRAYEDSSKWYADIIDQCAGKCGWLEASLLKAGADGLTNIAYGALDAGSVPKPGQTVESPTSPSKLDTNTPKPSIVGKINAGKFGEFELNSLSKTGTNFDPAVKSGSFTVAGRALQKHGSREGSLYPVAKGTPAQINEQGQKILDGIVKAPGTSVKEGNRFG